ncbi:hypothetical protein [Piscinibacter sp. XHJ-5]|uniref:hypothetical protein n=1 Tax=Piscinibacter sp. XHJ-5 TaxID=3037797 RepID=UPI002452B156|nr:hypothetical protein [Piscinibacter sp. XHJ-5]
MNRSHTWIALFSSVVLLSACGGGGGGSQPPAEAPAATDAVPSEASASMAGLMTYLTALAAEPVEQKEALDLGGFAPKSDEESEPQPLR